MSDVLRITVDTTDFVRTDEVDAVRTLAERLGFDVAWVSVTDRELRQPVKAPIFETLVLDESALDSAVLGSEEQGDLMEKILDVVGDGSFPKQGHRDDPSDRQKHQLRDAMILETHVREGRDVFVSGDEKGFVRHGRRERLQALCSTRILVPDEFRAEFDSEEEE